MVNQTAHNPSRTAKGIGSEMEQIRRRVERLLLRLDFNGELSTPRRKTDKGESDILAEGGLVL